MAQVSVTTLWNNWLVQNKFNAHVRPAHTKYAWLRNGDEMCLMRTVRGPSHTRKKKKKKYSLGFSVKLALIIFFGLILNRVLLLWQNNSLKRIFQMHKFLCRPPEYRGLSPLQQWKRTYLVAMYNMAVCQQGIPFALCKSCSFQFQPHSNTPACIFKYSWRPWLYIEFAIEFSSNQTSTP